MLWLLSASASTSPLSSFRERGQGVRALLSNKPAVLLLLALAACAPSAGPGVAAEPLLVAAASDLQFAFPEIGALYKQQSGRQVIFTFGSTGQLAQQIENGAPYDLFAAADVSYIEQLNAKGLIFPDTRQLYAQGRIVLAVNKQSGVQATELKQLSNPAIKSIAIANPDHAPYGAAAMQALQSAGLWEQLKPRLVYGDNITQALQFVRTGDAPAGIVALSLANVPEISYTLLDAGLHKPLNQMLAVTKSSKQAGDARAFIAFVNGTQGRPLMKKFGFALPGE
jgi:molybdate transport system substrate-binding protein